jgi:outer membrane biosynthesis protein TonB
MLRLIKEPILLAFLIVSYNFALVQLSHMLDVRLYPSSLSEKLHLTFFLSALYVAWLFGERLRTVAWIGLLFVFNVLLQATVEQRFGIILEQMPAFLITLLVIKLFESPVEKRWRQFQEEKHRLEEELSKNQKELMEALKTKRLHQELVEKLTKEKSELEKRIERLTEEETAEKERLLNEKGDIVKRLNSFKETLKGY